MSFVYITSYGYGYEGHEVVAIHTNRNKAMKWTEQNLQGDYVTLEKYPTNWIQRGRGLDGCEILAYWDHDWRTRKYEKKKIKDGLVIYD